MPNPEDASELSFSRAAEYRTIYSNLIRTRIGNGEVFLVFARLTHAPSLTAEAHIIEEQAEVIIAWPQVKMLSAVLSSLVTAIESEVGTIPLPIGFQRAASAQPEAQRSAVRSLGLSTKPLDPEAPAAEPTAAAGKTTKPRRRPRGKG